MDVLPGDIVSYFEMCRREGSSLPQGMTFGHGHRTPVLLMSRRSDAKYEDEIRDDGRVLVYEGHDASRLKDGPDPKTVDQPEDTPNGTLTQNGLFKSAALAHAEDGELPVKVHVYEKIKKGIWVFNGVFLLRNVWTEKSGSRNVFKFELELSEEAAGGPSAKDLPHNRIIPSAVKQAVWKRDGGRCVQCGSTDNLHFDHIVPFSKGGTSLLPANIQLLCARHNLEKSARVV
jgi:hypothetical protein